MVDFFCMDQSFRFGPEIAYVSALLLRTLKGEKKKTLVGTTDAGMILYYTVHVEIFTMRKFSPPTLIGEKFYHANFFVLC
jgi:hypothetical protein